MYLSPEQRHFVGDKVGFITNCGMLPEHHMTVGKEYPATVVYSTSGSTVVELVNDIGETREHDVRYDPFSNGMSVIISKLDKDELVKRKIAVLDARIAYHIKVAQQELNELNRQRLAIVLGEE